MQPLNEVATGPAVLKTSRRRRDLAGLIDSLLLIVARIGANFLALVWTFLLARMVAPAEAGLVFQAMALAQLGSTLLTFNLESGALRFLTPAHQSGDLAAATGFLRANRLLLVLLTLPVAIAMAGLLGLTLPDAGGALAGEGRAIWICMALAMPAIALARMTSRHATALGAVRRGLLPRLLTGPLVLALGLAGFRLFGAVPVAWQILALFALSEALAALIQQILLRDHFAFARGQSGSFSGWRGWLGQGLWLTPGLVMGEYRKGLLIATAGVALSAGDLGRFAVAFSIVNFINFGVVAVDVAYSPRLARALAAGQNAQLTTLLRQANAIKLAGFVLGAALVVGFGPMVLRLFGEGYGPAAGLLPVLLLLPLSSILAGPGAVLLSSRGLGRSDCLANLVGAAVSFAAIVLGAAFGGLLGAGWGAALGAAVTPALMWRAIRKEIGIDSSLAVLWHSPTAGRGADHPLSGQARREP